MRRKGVLIDANQRIDFDFTIMPSQGHDPRGASHRPTRKHCLRALINRGFQLTWAEHLRKIEENAKFLHSIDVSVDGALGMVHNCTFLQRPSLR